MRTIKKLDPKPVPVRNRTYENFLQLAMGFIIMLVVGNALLKLLIELISYCSR